MTFFEPGKKRRVLQYHDVGVEDERVLLAHVPADVLPDADELVLGLLHRREETVDLGRDAVVGYALLLAG